MFAGLVSAAAVALACAGLSCPLPADDLPPPRASRLTASSCDGSPWPPAVTFDDRQRAAFQKDGFVVLRGLLTPAVVAALVRELRHLCRTWPAHPDERFECWVTGAWARSDVSRDFLYYGPVGATVRDLLQVKGVRIQEDGYLVHSQHRNGTAWHTDANYHGGIYGDFHRGTRGATVWIALTDINHTGAGGTVLLARGGHETGCTTYIDGFYRQRYPLPPEPAHDACLRDLSARSVALSFRAGDALVWRPLVPHSTQPSLGLRMSWYARIVESDAVFCHAEYMTKANHAHAYCPHSLRPRQKARHVCYQQIHPLLAHEVAARMRANWTAPVLAMTPCVQRSLQRDVWLHGGYERRACID